MMPRLAHVTALLLALGAGLSVGCFTAPSDEVLFSCEFEGDDSCPPDYECRDDGCCHRVDSPADADVGACALGGGGGTGTGTETSTETGTETGMETETGETG